jgi:PTH2 family peptidyl-tRNA hydrolase
MDTIYKQIILVRKDLKLPKGKLAAQVAHASVEAVHRSTKSIVSAWRAEGMKKIVLEVKDLEELYKHERDAKEAGLTTAIITDAGHTVVVPGTTTCMAIGPDVEAKIDKITGQLKML